MRIFKVKAFERCAREELIEDDILRTAVQEMQQGLIDAKLGGSVYKKRIPAASHGKRGGARVIVAFQNDGYTFFMYMFLKKERDNIDGKELKALKQYAQNLLNLNDSQILAMMKNKDLFEIEDNDKGKIKTRTNRRDASS